MSFELIVFFLCVFIEGRSSGGRPYDYDRGFNQGKASKIPNVVQNALLCVISEILTLLRLLGGRGRYGDGPYNCNNGDGGK